MTEAHRLFPRADGRVYMNVAVRGLVPRPVRAAVERFLDEREVGGLDKPQLLEQVERVRSRFATLIGASPDEVAFTKNVSDGINLIATAVSWEPGDNVVVCPELEHPNNVFPWYNLSRRLGVEVRAVSPDGGRVPVEALVARMDERTRLVTVPTITFSPGFVTDLGPLSNACRERGTILLVDAAQSVGVLHTDVDALGVDALAVAAQKAMLGFYGTGFLYCRRVVADALEPAFLARFGVDMDAGDHETALGGHAFRYARGARRFDLGNYNYLGIAAADAALGLLLELGAQKVERHVRGLAHDLATGFLDAGLPLVGGPPGPHLAHIVALGRSGGGRHDTADDPAMNDLFQYLLRAGVVLSIRRGVLRFSVHLHSTEEDVDRVVGLAREWQGAGG